MSSPHHSSAPTQAHSAEAERAKRTVRLQDRLLELTIHHDTSL